MKIKKYKWHTPLCLPLRCAPVCSVLRVLLLFCVRVLPVVQIYATAAFLDGALGLLQGSGNLEGVAIPVAILAIVILVGHCGTVLANLLQQGIGNGIRAKYVDYLTTKCASLPYAAIENPEVWDLIGRVKDKPDKKVEKGFLACLELLGLAVHAAGFLAVLFVQAWWAVFLVAGIAGAVAYVSFCSGRKQYNAQREVAQFRRRYEYYGELLAGRKAAEERSLFGFFPIVQEKWEDSYFKARKAEQKAIVKSLAQMKAVSSSMALVTFGIAAILLIPLSEGGVTIGMYISLVQAASGVVDLMSWEFSDSISQYTEYKEYVKDFASFSSLPEAEGAREMPVGHPSPVETVEFDNVCFSYPGTEKKVLDGLSFQIEAGRHYAIVGRNGSGKTTIVKLLSGLYPEFEGEIRINGLSIRNYSIPELKGMLAVLFQDFARYEVSVRDNMALGNVRHMGSMEMEAVLEEAAQALGLWERIHHMPRGMDTPLGKLQEGGQGLSGGEWQRVAMARTMVSPASLLVLDEPTAALDPMAESQLYGEFSKISKGKTTLFISHRLGSVMLADEIILLEQGKALSQGSHAELMDTSPLYREMYEKQRSWYR